MDTIRKIFLTGILIFTVTGAAIGQFTIDRMEPPNWWTGMAETTLQVLFYGKNIGELTPQINHNFVTIDRIEKTENPNYLFVYFQLEPGLTPGDIDIQFIKQGKTEITRKYTFLERKANSAIREGYNSSDVIYLITPDRFANGDPTNDNLEGYADKLNRDDINGRHGGDIQGIINSLDYFSEMGFTSLWINPLMENNMPSTSYHGYAITDFYKTDPRYGSNEQYCELVEEAKKRGIKIIMDMIMNHCGSEHWWINDLPSEEWINNSGKFIQCNHRRVTIQDPYRSEADYRGMADGWFAETMPDMNQKNPLLADYLIENTIWWIEYSGIQGIRMDTYPYPDMDFMAKWSCRIMEEYPNFNMVGEEWTANPALVAYWQRGKENSNGYVSCLPGVFDFPIQQALVDALNHKESYHFTGLVELYRMLANDFLYADPMNLVTFADNHDMSRFFTQVEEDYNNFLLGITYVLTMRGIPQIYYGSEVLMANPTSDSHGEIRSDFPGGWNNDKTNVFTKEGLSAAQHETLSFFKTILQWRKQAEVIHTGRVMQFAPEAGIYVFFRYNEKKKVMVILNKNKQDTKLDVNRFYEMLEGIKTGQDVLTGNTFSLKESILIPAGRPLVLELSE